MAKSARIVLQRLALVASGIVAALLILEVALQIVAFGYRAWTGTRAERPDGRAAGHVRIVCIGDSNTFGLWVDPTLSYPAQLRKLLADSAGPDRYEVFNLGIPGATSGSYQRRFGEILDTFRPDIVIAMLGTGNLLRDPVAAAATDEGVSGRVLRTLRETSRLYRVYRYAVRNWQTPAASVPPEIATQEQATGVLHLGDHDILVKDHWKKKNLPERNQAKQQLTDDLKSMNDACRAQGIRFVVMTYLSAEHLYGDMNVVIRATTAQGRLTLIDNTLDLNDPRPGLFFPDRHPMAAGYSVIAHNVADFILKATPH